MTEPLNGLSWMPKEAKKSALPGAAEQARGEGAGKGAARRPRGGLDRPGGAADDDHPPRWLHAGLKEEVTEHLGREEHHPTAAREVGNVRNGTWLKAVLTDTAEEVESEVPQDRAGTLAPVIVAKRQRPPDGRSPRRLSRMATRMERDDWPHASLAGAPIGPRRGFLRRPPRAGTQPQPSSCR